MSKIGNVQNIVGIKMFSVSPNKVVVAMDNSSSGVFKVGWLCWASELCGSILGTKCYGFIVKMFKLHTD